MQGKGSFKGDINTSNIDVDVDVKVDVDIDSYFGCSNGVSKSVQVLFTGIEAAFVLTLHSDIASPDLWDLY